MSGLVTVGETMALFTSSRAGRLRHAASLQLGFAGAESNVAIGVSRLDASATWFGRVGDDELGELILRGLRAEQVDVSAAVRDSCSTSLMIKERLTSDLTRVSYYRSAGPGSRLQPDDLPAAQLREASVLHITGITPALSPSARETIHVAIELAREGNALVSLDYNYRAALWTAEDAGSELRDLTTKVDLVFAGEEEAALVVDQPTSEGQAQALAALGPSRVIITRGSSGATASIEGRVMNVDAVPVQSVDPVGAGDAFVAGYLAELLAGRDDNISLATAAACGAFAVTVRGDWEGMPHRSDLQVLSGAPGSVLR